MRGAPPARTLRSRTRHARSTRRRPTAKREGRCESSAKRRVSQAAEINQETTRRPWWPNQRGTGRQRVMFRGGTRLLVVSVAGDGHAAGADVVHNDTVRAGYRLEKLADGLGARTGRGRTESESRQSGGVCAPGPCRTEQIRLSEHQTEFAPQISSQRDTPESRPCTAHPPISARACAARS